MEREDVFNLPYIRIEIQQTLRPGEDADDVLRGAIHLAQRRAKLLGRPPTQKDLEYVLSIFCWWPFKTQPPPEVQQELLSVRKAAFSTAAEGRLDFLDVVVPEATLVASTDELALRQRRGVLAFLALGFGGQ